MGILVNVRTPVGYWEQLCNQCYAASNPNNGVADTFTQNSPCLTMMRINAALLKAALCSLEERG